MADNRTNFNDLNDFSGLDIVVPDAKTYAVVFRKSGPFTKVAYKFNLNSLGTSDLKSVKNKIKNFRETLENLTETFVTTKYLEDNDYMTKYDADKKRKLLATEETMKTVLDDYMVQDDLDLGIFESSRYATECTNLYATSMVTAAATAKSSNANAVSLDNAAASISLAINEDNEDEE